MPDLLRAGMAEIKVGCQNERIVALGLGSCIGVCLYDHNHKIGGIAHIMLPTSQISPKNRELIYEKFADTGVPLLVKKLKDIGAIPRALQAKIAGGAHMFGKIDSSNSDHIGTRNTAAVKLTLQKLGIPLIAEDTGGTVGRTVELNLEDMTITVRIVGKEPFYL